MPTTSFPNIHRLRLNFGKVASPADPPHLLQLQTDSYKAFLQKDTAPDQRLDQGLEAVFRSVFPIEDYSKKCKLEYVNYRLGEPKYNKRACRIRGATYSVPVRVVFRLIIWTAESTREAKKVFDIREQEMYLGEFPLMTETGSFIINGTERVIVNQLHKSPGVFFSHDKGKTHASKKLLYHCSVIPQRGSWIDFEFDIKNLFFARIDRKRKFYATIVLRALGLTTEDILDRFYFTETIDLSQAIGRVKEDRIYSKAFDPQSILNQKACGDILHPESDEILLRAGRKINKGALRKLNEAQVKSVPSNLEDILGRYSLRDVKDANGEVLLECNQALTKEALEALLNAGVESVTLLYVGTRTIDYALRDTLAVDKMKSPEMALLELYRKVKPGVQPTPEVAKKMLHNMFFSPDRFDLSRVGRMKLNRKLNKQFEEGDLENRALSKDDLLEVVEYLLHLKEGIGNVDDIDHLGNRRVRSVGELLENRYRVGLVRMERGIKERMALHEPETMTLHDIINSKPISSVINEFFGGSPLSQFMDQTNPLSEITHKRRLSALGPGGLTRERAGFEVRDVHTSHYGRICPVETPEGPNIGLISSLAVFARLNPFGFIETPYRKVEDGKITDRVEYMSAMDDERFYIAQANAALEEEKGIKTPIVSSLKGGEFVSVAREEVEYTDLSPQQLVSVAASMIPFLEHDDANRALMGSNMQRQAVPVIKPQAPLVGTGMEHQVAKDSGVCIVAERDGVVESVDSSRIVVSAQVDLDSTTGDTEPFIDIYHLEKYHPSNQNTCINQKLLVSPGMSIKKGQILTDGASCERGELALGQNILIAFMPWNGYNYEDSILVSEKLLQEDRFTSVHIEEEECMARDTKLGPEYITRDLPNVSEAALSNLDECGIVHIGSYVKAGDILVGKATPKNETQATPEERLLRSIFGDKAGDVRNTSLLTPQGIEGVVIDVKIFNRRGVDHDTRSQQIEDDAIAKIHKDRKDEVRIVKQDMCKKLMPLLAGNPITQDILEAAANVVLIGEGTILTEEDLMRLPESSLDDIQIEDEEANLKVNMLTHNARIQLDMINNLYEVREEREKRVNDLPPGVIKTVRVSIAVKRRLSVGDKMAGRHGNKGVISKILPREEMPYTEDGRSIDIVLNPLGVPSRMNVGQVLEIHLGLVAKKLGERIDDLMRATSPLETLKNEVKTMFDSPFFNTMLEGFSDEEAHEFIGKFRDGVYMATPVFDGAKESEIHRLMDLCGIDHSGKVKLYDGRTGDPFAQTIAVGYMYMLKLHHLVDDKTHSRSTGPYSLVTQQPLGGKAQFGGQRFGEMEVWALEGYGAAYLLRELLTVKSDDVTGRSKVYGALVKGRHLNEVGVPESFKVMLSEMKSLCLDVEMIKDDVYLMEGEEYTL